MYQGTLGSTATTVVLHLAVLVGALFLIAPCAILGDSRHVTMTPRTPASPSTVSLRIDVPSVMIPFGRSIRCAVLLHNASGSEIYVHEEEPFVYSSSRDEVVVRLTVRDPELGLSSDIAAPPVSVLSTNKSRRWNISIEPPVVWEGLSIGTSEFMGSAVWPVGKTKIVR